MLFSLWPLTTRRRNWSVCPLQQCLHQYPSSIGRSLSAQSWIVNSVLLKSKQPNIFYKKVKLLAIYYTSSLLLLFNFVSGFPFRSRSNPSNAATWTMDAIYWLGSSRAGNIIPKHHWDIYLAFWEPHLKCVNSCQEVSGFPGGQLHALEKISLQLVRREKKAGTEPDCWVPVVFPWREGSWKGKLMGEGFGNMGTFMLVALLLHRAESGILLCILCIVSVGLFL